MELIKKVIVSIVQLSDVIEYKNVPVVKYTIEYPEFHSRDYDSGISKINAYYKKTAYDFKKYIYNALLPSAIEDYNNSIENQFPIHEYEAMLTFTLTYNQSCVLSLYLDRYEYTGGAHGMTVRTSQTWRMSNGKQISLKELFPKNPNYSTDIVNEIYKQIEMQIANGTGAYFDNYKELVKKTFHPDNFYLTPDALAIYFQQYDIAPYASGMPTFFIPYELVNATLIYCNK